MIKELRLRNFRAFADHVVPLERTTLLVGENNAGKSAIVEALRLVALVTRRYRTLRYKQVPDWLDVPLAEKGVSPSLRNAGIRFDSLCHHYGEPPAVIDGAFADGCRVRIYVVDERRVHAVVRKPDGTVVGSVGQAREVDLPPIDVMHQAGPVRGTEEFLSPEYVRNAMASPLAPLHFRNQLKIRPDLFEAFKRAVAETWPQIRVMELIGMRQVDEHLTLNIRNEGFVGEIATMGHGLQMWLQTMWFLTRAHDGHTVVLDEPDVYMHPDLQRRLIRYLRGRYPQVIVTTHSVEMMSEARSAEIVVVRKNQATSVSADAIPIVKRLARSVGAVPKIHLARLWRSTTFLHAAPDDLAILKSLQDRLFPFGNAPLDAMPNMPFGGWEAWDYVIGTEEGLRNSLDEDVTAYCIMNPDYHGPEEIRDRLADAKKRGVQLHVWQRKEIENYLLHPDAISRVIAKSTPGRAGPDPQVVAEKINALADAMKDHLVDALAAELRGYDPRHTAASAGRAARKRMKTACGEPGGLVALVSGKKLMADLSAWSRRTFDAGFGPHAVANEMKAGEVAEEMTLVLNALEKGRPFQAEWMGNRL